METSSGHRETTPNLLRITSNATQYHNDFKDTIHTHRRGNMDFQHHNLTLPIPPHTMDQGIPYSFAVPSLLVLFY